MTGIAFVGCGYVADFYVTTLRNHSSLELRAVMDRDPACSARLAAHYDLRAVATLGEILSDPRVDIVVNLTNPRSHFEVTKAALEAGKHVYTEKPLGMTLGEAEELVALAKQRGLLVSGAPCSVLGECAQTIGKALREKAVGEPRLVYAEIDDGPVHRMDFRSWRSSSGAPWPYQDEFEVGCTLEHAGYYVTWLIAFFGPARRVTSFATTLVPEKAPSLGVAAADFSVGCIEFASGVVARITCSIFGPHNHALHIAGDDGVLRIDDCWDYGSTVRLQRRTALGIRAEKHPRAAKLAGLGPKRVPLVRRPAFAWKARGANRMDFARGIAEMARAIDERRSPRLSAEVTLHANEIVLALQDPSAMGSPRVLTTKCGPVEPMPWAK